MSFAQLSSSLLLLFLSNHDFNNQSKFSLSNPVHWHWTLLSNVVSRLIVCLQFLPDLLSLGVDTLLAKVTSLEMEDLAAVLKKPDDKRDGQVVAQYDRFYIAVKDRAVEFGIPLPPLFETDGIDRTALIYFNTDEEVYICA